MDAGAISSAARLRRFRGAVEGAGQLSDAIYRWSALLDSHTVAWWTAERRRVLRRGRGCYRAVVKPGG